MNRIHHCEASHLLASLPDASVDLIYTDPPFGTGDMQTSARKRAGKVISKIEYSDKYRDYLDFLGPHVRDMHRVLKDTGTMYLHLDWRWVHYAKVKCDEVFGYDNFLNEIVWSYNFGGRGKDRFPQKHDTILVYTKQVGEHTFNWDAIDRIPYAAPELQYVGRTKEDAEKRIAEGQVPTDVWTMSIVGTASKERLGYPNQKPVKLVKRVILASSNPGDIVLDPFAGSGTTCEAAIQSDRQFIGCDSSASAIEVMKQRFENLSVAFYDRAKE
jgi:site-specific DNA-methyltransferase (adenine-specific)